MEKDSPALGLSSFIFSVALKNQRFFVDISKVSFYN